MSVAAPFLSGDMSDYVNVAVRPGLKAGFTGAVGQDDFGRCILDRFTDQGVDATHNRVLPDRAAGIALVAYASDGSRKYILDRREAAAGQIGPGHVPEA